MLFYSIIALLSLLLQTTATEQPDQAALHHPSKAFPKFITRTSHVYPKHTEFREPHHKNHWLQCDDGLFRVYARRANTNYAHGLLGYVHFHGHDARLISTWHYAAKFTLTGGDLISHHNNEFVGALHSGLSVLERQKTHPKIGGDWELSANGRLELPGTSFCYHSADRDLFVDAGSEHANKECTPVNLFAQCGKFLSWDIGTKIERRPMLTRHVIVEAQDSTVISPPWYSTTTTSSSSTTSMEPITSSTSDLSGDLQATEYERDMRRRAAFMTLDAPEARATVLRRGATLTATWNA